MNQPLSKTIVEEMKDLGLITGTRSGAIEYFGMGSAYLRSLWSKRKDASLNSYFFLYVQLEDVCQNTIKAVEETTDPTEKAELQEGADAVNTLSEQVWDHMLTMVRDKQR
jgi:hypothetical protein